MRERLRPLFPFWEQVRIMLNDPRTWTATRLRKIPLKSRAIQTDRWIKILKGG